jgi:hypothetical protein
MQAAFSFSNQLEVEKKNTELAALKAKFDA